MTLKEAMAEMGWSKSVAAERLGVKPSTIEAWLHDTENVTREAKDYIGLVIRLRRAWAGL